MKIFISPNVNGPKELLLYQDLVKELRKLKVQVVSSIDVKKQQSERREFEEFDALILDGSSKEADTGYYLAIALAHKKPVLYLQQKGELLDPSIESLTKKKEVKKYIKIYFYSSDSYIRKVKAFLQYLDVAPPQLISPPNPPPPPLPTPRAGGRPHRAGHSCRCEPEAVRGAWEGGMASGGRYQRLSKRNHN